MSLQRITENYFLSLPLAMICVFLPLLNWLGLTWGVLMVLRRNIYVGAISLTIVGFLCFFMVNGLRIYGTLAELLGLLTFIVPMWALAYSLRLTRSLAFSLQLGFVILVIVTLANYWIYGPLTYDELYKTLARRMDLGGVGASGLVTSLQEVYLQVMVTTFLVAWPAVLFLMQILLLIGARYLQSRWYNPGGFKQEFHALRLSALMCVPFLAIFIWAVVAPSQLALQLAGLVALLYSIAGIAWLHWYIAFKQWTWVWVAVLYGIIFVISAWAMPLLILIGLLDSSINLRQKLINRV
ncbi:MAG TPA: hypothetical protein VI522_01710 [Gammaproteobacteria bacterium]|nr:hypothetical protein [Gammaproteobacteria bacterium]